MFVVILNHNINFIFFNMQPLVECAIIKNKLISAQFDNQQLLDCIWSSNMGFSETIKVEQQ